MNLSSSPANAEATVNQADFANAIVSIAADASAYQGIVNALNDYLREQHYLEVVTLTSGAGYWLIELSKERKGAYRIVFKSYSAVAVVEEAFRRITPKVSTE